MRGSTIIILVGPGEKERQRLYDFLSTLLYFEANFLARSTLVLVNDRNHSLSVRDVQSRFCFRTVVCIDNPYAHAQGGELIYDRLTAGIWAALAKVIELQEPSLVLKVDTDALVCGPFAMRLENYFKDHPETGMIGSLTHNPDGTRRDTEDWWGRWIRSTCGPVPHQTLRYILRGPERRNWHLEYRRWRARFVLYRRAVNAGWKCGANVLGGAYAVSPVVLRSLRENRVNWQDSLMFNGTRVSEDVALSMLIAALGMRLVEYNRPGEVFAVWYQKPTLTLREIISSGYGLVHSIKDPSAKVETELRTELAELAGIPQEFRAKTDSFRPISA